MPPTNEASTLILREAQAFYAESQLLESAARFQELLSTPLRREAVFGLSLIRMRTRDLKGADAGFAELLASDPANADVLYLRGRVAEAEGRVQDAVKWFADAVRVSPKHRAAEALASLQPVRTPPISTTPSGTNDRPAPALDFYDLLKRDRSEYAQQALALLTELERRVVPRKSAFASKFAGATFIGTLPIVVLLMLKVMLPRVFMNWSVFSSLVVASFFTLVYLAIRWAFLTATIRSTEFAFTQGRLEIRQGVFHKRVVNVELYRVLDLELRQGIWQRMTGDGTLELYVEGVHGSQFPRKMHMRGLAPMDDLRSIFPKLRSLIVALRSGPWGKGIIR